jgi:GH15 family glucan-1,4-alpha-glucosidase
LIRLGFTREADGTAFVHFVLNLIDVPYSHPAYMEFIYDRLKDKNPDGSIQIMYTIHGRLFSLDRSPFNDVLSLKGEKIFPEKELTHLDGHKGSKPVRIGNGAIDHIQLVSRLHAFDRTS